LQHLAIRLHFLGWCLTTTLLNANRYQNWREKFQEPNSTNFATNDYNNYNINIKMKAMLITDTRLVNK